MDHEEKFCIRCGESKPLARFAVHPGSGNLRNVCKDCRNISNRERYRNGGSTYHEEYRKRNKKKLTKYFREYEEKNYDGRRKKRKERYLLDKRTGLPLHTRRRRSQPGKLHANATVRDAISSGVLIRPESCSNCPRKDHIHGHHDSYLKKDRLNVRWLCARCHRAFHLKYHLVVILLDEAEVIHPYTPDGVYIGVFSQAIQHYPERKIPAELNDVEVKIYQKVFQYLEHLGGNFTKMEYGEIAGGLFGISAIALKE